MKMCQWNFVPSNFQASTHNRKTINKDMSQRILTLIISLLEIYEKIGQCYHV